MSDLDDLVADPVLRTRVGEHLTYLAATADVRRTPVEAIARRAATRRRRQRMAGATGAVAVVVGATVTALLALSSPRTIAPEDAPPTVDVPATTDPGSTPTSRRCSVSSRRSRSRRMARAGPRRFVLDETPPGSACEVRRKPRFSYQNTRKIRGHQS